MPQWETPTVHGYVMVAGTELNISPKLVPRHACQYECLFTIVHRCYKIAFVNSCSNEIELSLLNVSSTAVMQQPRIHSHHHHPSLGWGLLAMITKSLHQDHGCSNNGSNGNRQCACRCSRRLCCI